MTNGLLGSLATISPFIQASLPHSYLAKGMSTGDRPTINSTDTIMSTLVSGSVAEQNPLDYVRYESSPYYLVNDLKVESDPLTCRVAEAQATEAQVLMTLSWLDRTADIVPQEQNS